jgi:hypothetical protein
MNDKGEYMLASWKVRDVQVHYRKLEDQWKKIADDCCKTHQWGDTKRPSNLSAKLTADAPQSSIKCKSILMAIEEFDEERAGQKAGTLAKRQRKDEVGEIIAKGQHYKNTKGLDGSITTGTMSKHPRGLNSQDQMFAVMTAALSDTKERTDKEKSVPLEQDTSRKIKKWASEKGFVRVLDFMTHCKIDVEPEELEARGVANMKFSLLYNIYCAPGKMFDMEYFQKQLTLEKVANRTILELYTALVELKDDLDKQQVDPLFTPPVMQSLSIPSSQNDDQYLSDVTVFTV